MKGIHQIKIDRHDTRWGKMVRERDGKCLYCGDTETLQAHHLFPRSRSGTRFELQNGITLCASHHTFNYEFSAHKTPEKFKRWAKKFLGDGLYNWLQKKSLGSMTRYQAIKEFNEAPVS